MTHLENCINKFENMIGDMYYYGCMSTNDIQKTALMYFKHFIDNEEIEIQKVINIVNNEINRLIDLD